MIMISNEEYEALREARFWQIALEQAGVDNWEGFGDACDAYQRLTGEQETIVTDTENPTPQTEPKSGATDPSITIPLAGIAAMIDNLDTMSATLEYIVAMQLGIDA